jgi:hypothetical protein
MSAELSDAVSYLDLERVRTLLAAGHDPNQREDVEASMYPLEMVVFRLSDCMLRDQDFDTLAAITRVLLDQNADYTPALDLARMRYGDVSRDTAETMGETIHLLFDEQALCAVWTPQTHRGFVAAAQTWVTTVLLACHRRVSSRSNFSGGGGGGGDDGSHDGDGDGVGCTSDEKMLARSRVVLPRLPPEIWIIIFKTLQQKHMTQPGEIRPSTSTGSPVRGAHTADQLS